MARKRGPAPGVVGAPLAALYARAVARRSARFDRGEGVIEPLMPVVCVGNLSVGGVGKTPMVQWVVRRLRDAGHTPAIVMRGYRARGGVSDEAEDHRAALPGVEVVTNPDRAAAVDALARRPESRRPTCAVLDDGFQHRRLGRALDVVLIDARRSPWQDRLLPAGWLREPPAALARAGAVVLTHADLADARALDDVERRVAEVAPNALITRARHAWRELEIDGGTASCTEPVGWLAGRRVVAACAIGEPEQFLTMIRAAGAEVVGMLAGRDHAPFPRARLADLARAVSAGHADAIVSTAKDRPRLGSAMPAGAAGPVPTIVYPVVEMDVFAGADTLARAILGAVGAAPTGSPRA